MESKDLNELMAQTARGLQDSVDLDSLMQLAVDIAVRDVSGADGAALSIVHRRGRVDTPAASHASARHADELQYGAGQGPCLDAIWQEPRVQVPDIGSEQRWPAWSQAMREESGYRSMVVHRIFTAQDRIGALNLYSTRVDNFDDDDLNHAEALAAHLAVAIRSAREIEGLSVALDSRTVVGQAQGILMERFGLDAGRAFDVLTRVSSHSNRKLRDIAEEVVATRQVPATPRPEGSDEV